MKSLIPNNVTSEYWLKNCTIVQGAYLPVISKGCVHIKDGRFTAVGSASIAPELGEDCCVIDLDGAVLVPGFLNVHTHCALAVARGRFHGNANMVEDFFFPLESKMQPDDLEELSYPYMMSALASGTTLIADHYYHGEGTALAARKLGIRAGIAECLMDVKGAHLTQEAVSGYATFKSKFDWDERVFPMVGPHATDTCSTDLLRGLGEIAREQKLPLHMHLSQTKSELEDCVQKHGKTPVQYASDLGLLQKKSLLVHLISADASDLGLIRAAGSTAVACPASQVMYENILDPKLLKDSGVNIALATDCAASNDTADLYAEIRLYALLSKSMGVQWSADELLAMVTLNPARALGLEQDLGSIEAGKRADLQVIERGPELSPFLFPKQDLVYSMTSRLIRQVLVGGRVVFDHGRFSNVDGQAAIAAFEKRTAQLLERAGLS